jgi:hypothetical protein
VAAGGARSDLDRGRGSPDASRLKLLESVGGDADTPEKRLRVVMRVERGENGRGFSGGVNCGAAGHGLRCGINCG